MDKNLLISNINKMKKEQNAVIVAHSYQVDEVQEIADVTGDSFALSQYCASSQADTIVFCGVHFMAESAKILSPEKTVLLPEINAGCPMADMVTADALKEAKKKHPNAAVVCYINSSAEVKAECDICCTSSNAVDVIRSIDKKDIIFAPDKILAVMLLKRCLKRILFFGKATALHTIKLRQMQLLSQRNYILMLFCWCILSVNLRYKSLQIL
ncbi:quinolinate synthase NadA [Ruminiclostridium josui]|uniref:quinolinate synthase NadA n=1 Tax=Ruminiclostridium josui TaxID=1499 RepID=UPI000A6D3E80